jgi:ketosteroid isomerase-like protein
MGFAMAIFFRESGPVRTVRRYCAACNAKDLAAMARLMAEDFCIIDSTGEAVEGRANAVEAMRRFILLAPDFHIEMTSVSSHEDQVFMRGQATCSDERLAGDVLWRAVADNHQIHEWQSYSPESGGPHLTRILMPELQPAPPEHRIG